MEPDDLIVDDWQSESESMDAQDQYEAVQEPNDMIHNDHQEDDGMTDVEADADTLASCGWGTDEDYGGTDERL